MQLTHLATRYAISRNIRMARLLRSRRADELWASLADAYRQVGVYTGRILKGAKPVDLPVVQASKFELIINAQAARVYSVSPFLRLYSPAPTR